MIRDRLQFSSLSRSDRHLVRYMSVAHGLDHAVMLSIPIFVPVWIAEFDATAYELGLAVTAMAGLFGVMALPAGVLSDQIGADRLVSLFLLLTGGAFLLVPFIQSFLALAAVIALLGAGAGFYHPAALSLLSRRADSPSRVFAHHGVGANVGTAFGPILMTVGLAVADWRTVLPLLSIPLLAFGVLFMRRGPSDALDDVSDTTSVDDVTERLRSLATPVFVAIVGMYIFAGIYYRGSLTFLPDFLETASKIPPLVLGGVEVSPGRWVYSVILTLGALGQLLGGRLGERFGPERALIGVYVATGAVLAAIGLTSGTPVLVLGGVFGVLLFALAPAQQSLVSKYTPSASRGVGFGVVFTVNFGVGALGASLAGWVLTASTYTTLFVTLAVLPFAALLAVVSVRRLAATSSAATADGSRVTQD